METQTASIAAHKRLNSSKQTRKTDEKRRDSATYKLDPKTAFSTHEIEQLTEQVLIRRLRDETLRPRALQVAESGAGRPHHGGDQDAAHQTLQSCGACEHRQRQRAAGHAVRQQVSVERGDRQFRVGPSSPTVLFSPSQWCTDSTSFDHSSGNPQNIRACLPLPAIVKPEIL